MNACEACGGSRENCQIAKTLESFRQVVKEGKETIPPQDMTQAIISAAKQYAQCLDQHQLRETIRLAVDTADEALQIPESNFPADVEAIIYSQ